jgi:hypothetical protein
MAIARFEKIMYCKQCQSTRDVYASGELYKKEKLQSTAEALSKVYYGELIKIFIVIIAAPIRRRREERAGRSG